MEANITGQEVVCVRLESRLSSSIVPPTFTRNPSTRSSDCAQSSTTILGPETQKPSAYDFAQKSYERGISTSCHDVIPYRTVLPVLVPLHFSNRPKIREVSTSTKLVSSTSIVSLLSWKYHTHTKSLRWFCVSVYGLTNNQSLVHRFQGTALAL